MKVLVSLLFSVTIIVLSYSTLPAQVGGNKTFDEFACEIKGEIMRGLRNPCVTDKKEIVENFFRAIFMPVEVLGSMFPGKKNIEPKEIVEMAADIIWETLRSTDIPLEIKQEVVRAIFEENADIKYIGQRCLLPGNNYRGLPEDIKRRYDSNFRRHFMEDIFCLLNRFTNQSFRVGKQMINGDYSEVVFEIFNEKGSNSLVFAFRFRNGRWMVVDIVTSGGNYTEKTRDDFIRLPGPPADISRVINYLQTN